MSSRKPAPRANLERPPQPGRVRSVILAIVVHAIFFAFIVFGVNWQTRETAPYQAELWEKLPAAPAKPAEPTPEPPKPEPEPPKPEPEPPKPPPEPPKPPPKPPPEEKPEPPKPDPEIALKAEREKKAQERKAREEKLERDKREKEKAEREKQKREEARRKLEEQQAFEAAQKQRAAASAQRQQEFNEWVGKIRDKIRGKANVPDTVTGRPEVVVHIRILPGGEVFDVAIVKSSGNPTYDAAIERAVRSSSPLPVPAANTELFSQFRDLNLNIKHDR